MTSDTLTKLSLSVSKRPNLIPTCHRFPQLCPSTKLLELSCDFEVTYLLLAHSSPQTLLQLRSLSLYFQSMIHAAMLLIKLDHFQRKQKGALIPSDVMLSDTEADAIPKAIFLLIAMPMYCPNLT